MGNTSVAIGYRATSSDGTFGTVSIGDHAQANSHFSTAVGTGARTEGYQATAIGGGAYAAHENSSAFGVTATTTRNNQIVLGTAGNSYTNNAASTYTLAGLPAASSNAAQVGPLQMVTTDSAGNLGTAAIPTTSGGGGISAAQAAAMRGDIDKHTSQIAGLQQDVNRAFKQIDQTAQGVAIAVAMSGAPTLLPTEQFAITGNWGQFDGRHAVGFNAAMRLNGNVSFNAGLGTGLSDSDRQAATRLGFRIGW